MKRKKIKPAPQPIPETRHDRRCSAESAARKSNPKAAAHYRQFYAFAGDQVVWCGPHIIRRVSQAAAIKQQRRWMAWRRERFPNESRPVVDLIVIEDRDGKNQAFRI